MKIPFILLVARLPLSGCNISSDSTYKDVRDCYQEASDAVAQQEKNLEKQCMIKRGYHNIPQN